MNTHNFVISQEDERVATNLDEYKILNNLAQLSPTVNSLKDFQDYFLLILDLPNGTKGYQVSLSVYRKSFGVFIKRGLDKPYSEKPARYFFRNIKIPKGTLPGQASFKVIDHILFVKIPKKPGSMSFSRVLVYFSRIVYKKMRRLLA